MRFRGSIGWELMQKATIWTIGHSTHPIESFLELLEAHGITAIADVRSVPYSRYQPQFNRESLQLALRGRGVGYVFLGGELGARPADPACHEDGRVCWSRLKRTPAFGGGIERVLRGSESCRIALMCAEGSPIECHRGILVARELHERGVVLLHVLPDGSSITHDEAMANLLVKHGLQHEEMWRTHSERLEDALCRQEQSIAYTVDAVSRNAGGEAS